MLTRLSGVPVGTGTNRNNKARKDQRANPLSNRHHRDNIERSGGLINYDRSPDAHIRSQLFKNDYSSFGAVAKNSLKDLNYNKYIGLGISGIILSSAIGGGYLGFNNAVQIATLANNFLPSRISMNPKTPFTQSAVTALTSVLGLATASAMMHPAKKYFEKRKAHHVDALVNTIKHRQVGSGLNIQHNNNLLETLSKKKNRNVNDTIADLKLMASLANENAFFTEDNKYERETSQRLNQDISHIFNIIETQRGNDLRRADALNGITNPKVRSIIDGLFADDTVMLNKEIVKQKIINAFPDHIGSLTDLNIKNFWGNTIAHPTLQQYKDALLARTTDENLKELINVEYNQPGATIKTMRDNLLGHSLEGVRILVNEADIKHGGNPQATFDIIATYTKDHKIIEIADGIRAAGGNVKDGTISYLNNVVEKSVLNKSSVDKNMQTLPTNITAANSPDILQKGQDFTGNTGGGTENTLNRVIGYKLAALEEYGITVTKSDLGLADSNIDVNEMNTRLSNRFDDELDNALPLYLAKSGEVTQEVSMILQKFETLLRQSSKHIPNTDSLKKVMVSHINEFEDCELIQSVLTGALEKFIAKKKTAQHNRIIKDNNRAHKLHGEELSRILKEKNSQIAKDKRKKMYDVVQKFATSDGKFKFAERKQLNKIINTYNNARDGEKVIYKRFSWKDSLKDGGIRTRLVIGRDGCQHARAASTLLAPTLMTPLLRNLYEKDFDLSKDLDAVENFKRAQYNLSDEYRR